VSPPPPPPSESVAVPVGVSGDHMKRLETDSGAGSKISDGSCGYFFLGGASFSPDGDQCGRAGAFLI
jgi:hypothetical protein